MYRVLELGYLQFSLSFGCIGLFLIGGHITVIRYSAVFRNNFSLSFFFWYPRAVSLVNRHTIMEVMRMAMSDSRYDGETRRQGIAHIL